MGCKSRFHVDIMDYSKYVTPSLELCAVTFPNGEKVNFIVDCGIFQGVDEEEEKRCESFYFNPADISFALVTHNHTDHIGRLSLLSKKGFGGKIYATESTCRLLPASLKDACRIARTKSKANRTRQMYGDVDVKNTLELCIPCEYNKPIRVHEHIDAYFFENCHMPGAAMILVRIKFPEKEDINLLFTGDYNDKSTFKDEVKVPKWLFDLPITVIQESTYGDIDSEEIEPCFEANFLKAIEEKKTVICMVFSQVRAQEILYRIKCMQDEGKLNTKIPVYLDGKLAITYTGIYAKGVLDIKPEMVDFLPQHLIYIDNKIKRSALLGDNSCKIILTSSGMGSHGPARTYIPAFVQRKNVLLHFTGYTAKGTVGRIIKDTPKGEEFNAYGMRLMKRAVVEYTSEFSSHAQADTMIDFLKQFSNLKLVLVNHGDPEVKKSFAHRVFAEVDTKHVGILGRDALFRVNTWGVIKTINTKFI